MGDDAYVEAVLQELIQRFTQNPRKADVRQALLEAKRLKSIASNWVTVAPSPDSRTAFMERMSALLANAEADAPPGTPGITPARGLTRARTSKSSVAKIEGLSRAVSTTSLGSQAATKGANRPAPPTKRTQQFPGPRLQPQASAPLPTAEPVNSLWRSHGDASGVEVQIVHRDVERGTCAALLRIEAGKDLSGARQGGELHVMVLQGILQIGSKALPAGGSRWMRGELANAALSTTSGCTLAVVGSVDDPLFR